jgi:peptidyl-prolyl cis-trans isomerase B (cyclophilin B)
VFGKVTAGQEIVDKMAAFTTGRQGYHDDVPVEDVMIEKAVVI